MRACIYSNHIDNVGPASLSTYLPSRWRRHRLWRISLSALALGVLGVASPARALDFNVTFDDSLTNLAPMATIKQSFGVAEQYFQSTFTDPITINLRVTSTDSGLAASVSSSFTTNYASIFNALKGDRTSAADNTAFSSGTVPSTDPFGALTNLTTANAKAINLLAGNATGSDGTIMFSTNAGFAFGNSANDPGRAISNRYDFIGVAEHEISEVMGRISWLDVPTNGNYLLDLFRYTGAGARNTSIPGPGGVKFSFDNGTNLLTEFSSAPAGLDPNDWSTNNVVDAYNARGTLGQAMGLTGTDATVLDVIGYDVPEPGVLALAGTGSLGALVYWQRARRRNRLG